MSEKAIAGLKQFIAITFRRAFGEVEQRPGAKIDGIEQNLNCKIDGFEQTSARKLTFSINKLDRIIAQIVELRDHVQRMYLL
jgi:hypothetical protein